jgi:hypothetical protein
LSFIQNPQMRKSPVPLMVSLFLQLQIFSQKHFVRDSSDVMKEAKIFIHAFNNFEWEPFRNSFADEATMFHTDWTNARRLNGRNEIESTWLKIFPEFKDTANRAKMAIDPQDIQIQVYGNPRSLVFTLVMASRRSAGEHSYG